MSNTMKVDVFRDITKDYLPTVDKDNFTVRDVRTELVDKFNIAIDEHNAVCNKNNKWQNIQSLPNYIIVDLIVNLYHVRKLCYNDVQTDCDESDCDLVIYQSDGKNKGLYVADKDLFYNLISEYNPETSIKQRDDILVDIKSKVELCHREQNKDLIPVANGIYDYANDKLLNFSPDYVFTSKINTEYNDTAKDGAYGVVNIDGKDVDIHDVIKSWAMNKQTGIVDKDFENLLWQVIGAAIRNNVPWNMIVFLYSEQGSNGKGTFCKLIRNLIGYNRCASLRIADFSVDYKLAELTKKTVIIADENPTNAFTSDISNLKALTTGDSININRKYKNPVSLSYKGLIIQCINSLPKTKDQSESWYRRQLFMEFKNRFVKTDNNTDIKDALIENEKVLQHILYTVLHMPKYYKFSVPQSSIDVLDEYREYNDPIRQFTNEILPQLQWDLIPWNFLYDLYKAWFSKNCPSGQLQSKNSFTHDIRSVLYDSFEWDIPSAGIWAGDKITCSEPLIAEYDLKDWYNPIYHGNDINKKCMPVVKNMYRGLVRK